MKFIVFLSVLLVNLTGWRVVSAQEINLFNGRDLTGWSKQGGDGDFKVQDGCIVGKNIKGKGPHTFLCTQAEYGNFILTFEFIADKDMNSGVQFRSEYHKRETEIRFNGQRKTIAAGRVYGYQFEIDTSDRFYTGGIYDEGRRGVWLDEDTRNPSLKTVYNAGGWNTGRIECYEDSITTYLNGTLASPISNNMTRSGVIALQIHGGNQLFAEVRWRNIRLLPLTGRPTPMRPNETAGSVTSAPNPAPPMNSIPTDPNQPRIEVLKEQGINAVEWALSPLQQPVPPDIRQNIALLREDLLDEAKQKPAGSEQAYALGSQLCDKLLIALEERNKASVEAGYTAALADAGVKVTSQALEARRNYQMSWTQYQREESQRSEIGRQQMSAAEVKKEKIKVNWAVRTEAMRRYLDALYRQFREAMR